MRLVRLLSLPYLAKHRLRTLLTLAGIALGVAVLVAMHAANQAVLGGLRETVTGIAGTAELQISAGGTGVLEDVLDRVRALPETGFALPAVEGVVATGPGGEGSLLVLGIDVTADRGIRDYGIPRVEDPLAFLAQPDSLLLTSDFARRHGLAIGSSLVLQTAEGPRPFRVRGLFNQTGLTVAFGGNFAVMDIYAAQLLFGKERVFDRIDITARQGVSVEACRRAIAAAVGPGLRVDTPSERRRYFDDVLANYRRSVDLASFFALIIGLFLIQNTFVVAVTQRRFEIGVIRALGATRAQVRTLFLLEGACLGLAGSLMGALAGAGLARLVAAYVARSLEGLYGVRGPAAPDAAGPILFALAVAAGTLCGIFAAMVPAAAAARSDPVRALQKGRYEMVDRLERRYRRRLGCAAACLAVLLFLPRSEVALKASYLCAALAVVFLMPEVCGGFLRLVRPLVLRIRPVEGALAADSLLASPRATASVAAALMLSVSMVIGLGGIAEATYSSIERWVTGTLDADLLVSPTQNLKDLAFRLPGAMEAQLASIPGVRVVQPVRTARISVLRSEPVLFAVDVARLSAHAQRSAVPVNTADVHGRAAQGAGVIVSESLAAREHLRTGDELELPAPEGALRLPILATYEDFTDPQGTVVIDRSLYRARWRDETVNLFRLYLDPAAPVERVRTEVLARWSPGRKPFIFSSGDLRRYILGLASGWFRLVYAQLGVAILVAVLGIASSLTVSITDRRRELGILRAVGGFRRQVRVAVWIEAVLIASVGFLFGIAFSVVNIFYGVAIYSGHTLGFHFPALLAAALLPVLVGAALLAAAAPAEAAVRGSLTAALEYE